MRQESGRIVQASGNRSSTRTRNPGASKAESVSDDWDDGAPGSSGQTIPDQGGFAILAPSSDPARQELAQRIIAQANRLEVRAALLDTAEEVRTSFFDFVLCLTALQPKLSHCPSYALFDRSELVGQPIGDALARVLSHDGYLVRTPLDRQYLEDLAFGSRKRLAFLVEAAMPPPPIPTGAAVPRSKELLVLLTTVPDGEQLSLLRMLADRLPACFVALDAPRSFPIPVKTIPADGCTLALLAARHSHALCLAPTEPNAGLEFEVVLAALQNSVDVLLTDGDIVKPDERRIQLDTTAPLPLVLRSIEQHLAKEKVLSPNGHRNADGNEATCLISQLLAKHTAWQTRILASTKGEDRPQVAYIIRAGGRSPHFLRRALNSLERQTHPNLIAILVLWRESPELEELLQEDWRFERRILVVPEGSRSQTLAAGLAAVKLSGAAWFGILDDDDALHPNHVHCLLETLDSRRDLSVPLAEVAYSGAVEVAESEFQRPSWDRIPVPIPARTMRPGAFFFPNPHRLWSGAVHLPPNAFLAASRLIDREVLAVSNLSVGEDTHLLNLLAERSHFAFSVAVTADYHFHNGGQSDWWIHAELPKAGERLALRTFGRLIPLGAGFGGLGLPPIDDRLGAPVTDLAVSAPLPHSISAAAGAAPDHHRNNQELRVTNLAPLELADGLYDAEWFFDDLEWKTSDQTLRGTLTIGSEAPIRVGPLQATRSGTGWRLAHPIPVRLPRELVMGSLVLNLPTQDQAAPLAVRLTQNLEGLFMPWTDLPPDRQIWLFGAGAGGRDTLRLLHDLRLADRVAGFLDNGRGGCIGELKVHHPSALANHKGIIPPLILIASQYWPEIRREILDMEPKLGQTLAVYRTYPINSRGLWRLA